ncbi:TetR family transcriptional regulator [Mycolicibacterium chubuense]|uniref:Putative HTH-type transcriptional regulator TtgW n=1 Tax=Mycolicibacterium chubuense TaxID=1800 RepID=A0A0J6ZET1_MYCCU|nr:TetR/AcrR family transcriptional regulator [Mycolicibacterium chubuense]KMO83296.1 putative HTH-type transcriptional regulator TtgW [Mycolicibacterium chubuense]ORA43933.1 TetR family transcriptional regulator [Mycolicibacterium chubuense]SPX96130.1 transcriptional regulator [Mycolicibacterium chubuense]
MSDSVKREYQSPLRSAQAQATRRRIVAAAADLFVSSGFAGTSVDAIADVAGVSRKTVFTAVGGKTELLALALDWAVAGDDVPVPLAARPDVIALLGLPRPGAVLDAWAAVLTDIDARVDGLFAALECAAASDEVARALFDRVSAQRREGAAAVVDAVAALGGLRDELSRSEAVDLAALFTEPLLHRRLVGARGWSRRRFETWLADTLRRQLLSRPDSR